MVNVSHRRSSAITYQKAIVKRSSATPNFNNVDTRKHVAIITTKKGRNLSTIGFNKYHPTIKHGYTTHAEVDAMQKSIRPIIKKYGRSVNKRRIPVTITVLRTTMVNSHPCLHCINAMNSNSIFKVKRVNYSFDGDIKTASMASLLSLENYHISKGNRTDCCNCSTDCSDECSDEEEGKGILSC